MQNIENLFAYSGRKVWVRDAETKDLIPGNPFSVKEDCILDASRNVRDDIVGRFYRGKITVDPDAFPAMEKGERYWFFTYPSMRLKYRSFNGYGVDYLNILVGNAFREKEVSEKDEARVKSFFDAISRINKPLFTSFVQDGDVLVKRFKEAAAEQEDIPPVDPDFPEDTENRGILKRIAKQNQED